MTTPLTHGTNANADLRGLAEAREALARFDGDSRDILARRLSGKRKSAPMNRHLPGAETWLRAALAEIDRLRAENEGLRAAALDRDAEVNRIREAALVTIDTLRDRLAEADRVIALAVAAALAPTLPTERSDK